MTKLWTKIRHFLERSAERSEVEAQRREMEKETCGPALIEPSLPLNCTEVIVGANHQSGGCVITYASPAGLNFSGGAGGSYSHTSPSIGTVDVARTNS